MVYKKVHDANEAYIGCDCLTIKDKVVTAVERNKGSRKDRSISLETYVINTKTLLKVMKQAQKISSFVSLKMYWVIYVMKNKLMLMNIKVMHAVLIH